MIELWHVRNVENKSEYYNTDMRNLADNELIAIALVIELLVIVWFMQKGENIMSNFGRTALKTKKINIHGKTIYRGGIRL